MKSNFNKKADIESLIYIVIFLFVIGVVFFFMNTLNQGIFGELQSSLNDTYGHTESMTVLQEIKTKDQSIWDYAFLGIFIGSLLAIGLSAWSIRISPIFFWIYGILSLIVLGLGVILSNVWQDFAAEAEFADIISYFPITNAILGTYYPVAVTAIIVIMMGLLFGKPPQE